MASMSERPDLSRELTVFVLTVGSSTFEKCLAQLQSQDCMFRFELIDHVAPMSAALQQMHERCETPLFMQVDEDMILYPHAVRTLYRHMREAAPEVAQVTYQLWDPHAERVIYGLKIYRHELVKRYPYRNVQGCEWDQFSRYHADGLLDIRIPIEDEFSLGEAVLGEHWCNASNFLLYERYRTLEMKWRRHDKDRLTTSVPWVEEQATVFLRRFFETASLPDLYALLGALSGRLAPLDGTPAEKDFRNYANLPGFEAVDEFVARSGEKD
jgi:hypothetical protein